MHVRFRLRRMPPKEPTDPQNQILLFGGRRVLILELCGDSRQLSLSWGCGAAGSRAQQRFRTWLGRGRVLFLTFSPSHFLTYSAAEHRLLPRQLPRRVMIHRIRLVHFDVGLALRAVENVIGAVMH